MPSTSEAKVTPITKKRDPFDFPVNTDKVSYMGVDYTFRELTVQEIDDAREAATNGEKFDTTLMTRMMISTGAVEPTMSLEQMAKLPQRLFNAIIDCVNELNDPEAIAIEEQKRKKGDSKPGNS